MVIVIVPYTILRNTILRTPEIGIKRVGHVAKPSLTKGVTSC